MQAQIRDLFAVTNLPAWRIADAQKAGDTHPVRTPGLRDMS